MQSNTIPREKTAASKAVDGYRVNEIFYSLQGEGVLAGTAMVFVRLSGCNLRCSRANAGFDCDTEFVSGHDLDAYELLEAVEQCWKATADERPDWVLLTGGEPGLQLDDTLVAAMHSDNYLVAVETNGTVKLPDGLDHVCVSPKSAWHTIRQREATELKLVREPTQTLPSVDELPVDAEHYLVSPAARDGAVGPDALQHCIDLVLENPAWRLSTQQHKFWRMR